MNNSRLVVTAGFAEIVAGCISMGLGGFLAGRSEIEHYDSERTREEREVREVPYKEEQEIYEIFEPYNVPKKDLKPLVDALISDPVLWVDFMVTLVQTTLLDEI